MPVLTPQITLTVNLFDYSGAQIGASSKPAYLRVVLAGFGLAIPRVLGTGVVGKIASMSAQDIPYVGAQINVLLWGNDVIQPAGTYYAISVLDANRNVVQTGAYKFTGSGTFLLSDLTPLVHGQF